MRHTRRHKTKTGQRGPQYHSNIDQHEPRFVRVQARCTLHMCIHNASSWAAPKTHLGFATYLLYGCPRGEPRTRYMLHETAQVGFLTAHVRMILDVSVFPAPDSPETTIDWLAALRPAPRRIWWYASCKTRNSFIPIRDHEREEQEGSYNIN